MVKLSFSQGGGGPRGRGMGGNMNMGGMGGMQNMGANMRSGFAFLTGTHC